MEKYGDWNFVSENSISNGYFGEVFEVWDYAPGTRVVRKGALKVLLDPDYVASVKSVNAEIETYATLNCPQIPRFLEAGKDSAGLPWLVVEFIDGQTLESICDIGGSLSTSEVLEIGKDLSQALKVAHGKTLKHLDIKPDNVMRRNSGGWVLLDFGLSTKQYQKGIGLRNNIYSAPEQFRTGNTITSAADIFSLGATLYYALTRHNPYDVYHPMSYEQAVQTKGPSLSQAPEDLRDLIGSMMHMKPEHRPTAAEVNEKINSLLSGSPEVAWHPERIKAWGQLSDLVATGLLKGSDFALSLTQPGNIHAEIKLQRVGDSWQITLNGETALGKVLTPVGRSALTGSQIRMSRDGTFTSTGLLVGDALPDLVVQIVKNGLEFSLAELSYKVSR